SRVPVILVGNKTDLEEERQVTPQMVQDALKDQSKVCKYLETSAKYNVNVARLFIELLEHARELEQPPPAPQQSRRLSRRLSSLGNINLAVRRKSSLPKVTEAKVDVPRSEPRCVIV
ncbi:ras-related protein Rap-1b-like, partial [Stegodyphus dumicola]|uniref:ras-related protein Rap-1b-like n=1 Tax=Stegodyphus dumicola TaxID=202533 RepID=UPI0015B06152